MASDIKTKVVHCNKESYDVMIDRTTKWGNPYHADYRLTRDDAEYLGSVQREGGTLTRSERIALYENYLRNNTELFGQIEELRGKTLGCWCKPEKNCHGDIIVKLLKEKEFNELFGY